MPFDDDPDDARPDPDGLLPPEDRLWRHPSELGGTIDPPPPTSTSAARSDRVSRRTPALPILAGACLAGAVVAIGAMWVARPTKVVERELPTAQAADSGSPATFVTSETLPTEGLAEALTPAVTRIQVVRNGEWSNGSAVWVDDAGTLAAAGPMVGDADEVLVIDPRGASRPARLAGVDPVTGVAALVVDDAGGSPVSAAARRARTGEAAALIGAAGTHAGSGDDVTVATVTIRAPSLRASVQGLVLHDAIQLDREVPSDAIGGALVDRDGAVLGMVVGNSSERGLGTAVAGPTLVEVATSLRHHGEVRRAVLGVRAADLDRALAEREQVPSGTRLIEVTADSPAEEAGLRVNDVVTAIGDEPVDDASDLVVALHGQRPGAQVEIYVRRDGQDRRVAATLGG